MRRAVNLLVAGVLGVTLLSGCGSASRHAKDVRDAQDGDRLTVGTVQREVRVGMSSADVIQVMGSPNIVSSDDKRREVWIYDKISTDQAYSSSSGGVNALILGAALGGAGMGGAGMGGGYSSGSGASSTSQRTLTVIIKFDDNHLVRDFSYHTSRF